MRIAKSAAAVARERGDLEVFVNISQMTVSQMSLTDYDGLSPATAALARRLNWSGLPVVHVRATVFLQNFFFLAWAAESSAPRERRLSTLRMSRRWSPSDRSHRQGL
jgi:NAD(P)H dehydrogenase (quinone)